MTPIASELLVSGNGHRLLAIAYVSDRRLKVRLQSSTAGYGFPGRSPILFSLDWEPGVGSIDLGGARYASGLALRSTSRPDYEAHLLGLAGDLIARRPELKEVPCLLLRKALGGTIQGECVLETGIGEMQASWDEDGWTVEMLACSGREDAPRRKRELLIRLREGRSPIVHAWSIDDHGRRAVSRLDANEMLVVDGLVRRAPTDPGSPWGLDDGTRPADGYDGMRPVLLPEALRSAWEVSDARQLVDRFNERRALHGRPPLASGSFPTSMVKLRAFLRLAEREMRAA